MSTNRVLGVVSLAQISAATALGAVALFTASATLGAVYVAASAAGLGAVITAFCAKCPCKAHCGHLLPGLIARHIHRTPGPYRPIELAALSAGLLVLVLPPQPWLWRSSGLFVAYWALALTALVEIRAVVCQACANVYCPLKAQRMHTGG